ncbi:MAG: alanine racemase, partial [Candidatus Omnitrophica bacterium]|nr:alanine racemase [Candidatus Omnitrophota bacterium]
MSQFYDAKSPRFSYREKRLFVEDVCVDDLTARYGSPLYVYSQGAILDSLHGYQKGLEGVSRLIAFAVKANGSLAILHRLAQEGAGADLTSGGELALALRSGIPAERMVFSGVGKTDPEIKAALDAGILMFNIESAPELDRVAHLAKEGGKIAPVAIRVNPNIDPKTHPKISTGLKGHKFGVPVEQARRLYKRAAEMESVRVRGIAAHIGSSLMDTSPLLQALDLLLDLRRELQREGMEISHLDLGGGLGIQYEAQAPETPSEYAQKLRERIREEGLTLIVEPGRSMVG